MTKTEIIEKATRLDKNGFVVYWTLRDGKVDGGKLIRTASLIKSLDALEAKGIQVIEVTPQGGPKDRSALNEQVAAYLAVEDERRGMEEDNDLDEQFWRRDA